MSELSMNKEEWPDDFREQVDALMGRTKTETIIFTIVRGGRSRVMRFSREIIQDPAVDHARYLLEEAVKSLGSPDDYRINWKRRDDESGQWYGELESRATLSKQPRPIPGTPRWHYADGLWWCGGCHSAVTRGWAHDEGCCWGGGSK